MRIARYWHQEQQNIRCELCPHGCLIEPDKGGICQIRIHRHQQLLASNYNQVTACAVDPIEKKPLFHVKPGQAIFSIGSAGCNFKCAFCQNWEISQMERESTTMTPGEVATRAVQAGCCGVAYTYNEPVINIEYVLDCAQAAHQQGLINVMVSNGYINPKPLEDLIPRIDAWNVDLKSMSDTFYHEVCGGHVGPVLRTIQRLAAVTHIEITHLMVNHPRNSLEQFSRLVDWIAAVSPRIPLHISRYFPHYQFDAEATAVEDMQAAYKIAKEKLDWVYIGNLPTSDDHTYCPKCQTVLIERHGYRVNRCLLAANQCPECQEPFYGVL